MLTEGTKMFDLFRDTLNLFNKKRHAFTQSVSAVLTSLRFDLH